MNYKKVCMRKTSDKNMKLKGYEYKEITLRVTRTIYNTFEAWVSDDRKEYIEFYKQI